MEYEIMYEKLFEKGVEKHKKSGDKSILMKINALLDELRTHPKTGSGKPEQLKYDRKGQWSRRITGEHRLVYVVNENKQLIVAVSCYGHYQDK